MFQPQNNKLGTDREKEIKIVMGKGKSSDGARQKGKNRERMKQELGCRGKEKNERYNRKEKEVRVRMTDKKSEKGENTQGEKTIAVKEKI